uniref:Uncharacterized protein n=1 Tax=Meloidogyne incognita TaxID=6306 RepID=A0A914P1E9_MELIC
MPVEYLLVDVPCGVRKVLNYTFPRAIYRYPYAQQSSTATAVSKRWVTHCCKSESFSLVRNREFLLTVANQRVSHWCVTESFYSLLQIREFLTGA